MKLTAGQTAVVTGSASGIGLALARALADRSLNVVMADLDQARVQSAAKAINGVRAFLPLLVGVWPWSQDRINGGHLFTNSGSGTRIRTRIGRLVADITDELE